MSVVRTIVWNGPTVTGGTQQNARPDPGQGSKPIVGRVISVAGDVDALDVGGDIIITQDVVAGMPAHTIFSRANSNTNFRHRLSEPLADNAGAVTTDPVLAEGIFVNGPLALSIAQAGDGNAYRIELTYEELISH